MDVSSVSSNLYAAVAASSQTPVRARQPEQDQQAPQSLEAQKSRQTQGRQSVEESDSAARARDEADKNRVTVNTSGQVVGTRVNTTA